MNKKEIYRLWFKYLKRSENYRKYCEWEREKKKNLILSIPEEFRNEQGRYLDFIYSNFFDVHTSSFDEWWEWKTEHEKLREEIRSPDRSIQDYTNFINEEIQKLVDDFKYYEGRDPTLEEFINSFVQRIENNAKLYLIVDPVERTEILMDRFKRIIREKKKEPSVKRLELFWRETDEILKSRIEFDNLKVYLRVYDLRKQKIKWQNIMLDEEIARINKDRSVENENDRRLFQLYRQKAERIIKNVEEGYFPGDYQ